MRTIAQAAGVNVATVSRALRGVAGVSPRERERICAQARSLGYHPNPFVSAFTAQVRTYRRTPSKAVIALLDCWPVDRPVWADFDDSLDYIGGISRRAAALGYQTERIRFVIDLDASTERLNRLLVTRRIHGCLALPVPTGTDLSGLDYARLACATIDFSLQLPVCMRRASPNYYHNMSLVLSTLVARGCRRIGYVMTRVGSQRQDELGLSAFLAFRLNHPHTCVAPGLLAIARYREDFAAWLDRERPDAVVSADLVLPGDIEAAGRRVPDDLAGVSLARPPAGNRRNVAHVDENYELVGALAVDLIVDSIHRNEFGLPSARVVHFVDGFWCEGSTVRPPAARG
jgi:DNA-binding LacI/PurR family transcriptional regulator